MRSRASAQIGCSGVGGLARLIACMKRLLCCKHSEDSSGYGVPFLGVTGAVELFFSLNLHGDGQYEARSKHAVAGRYPFVRGTRASA
jgi:hypothetical protein